MKMKNNSKVPVAILSSFLIAFILQGVLKVCGVLIFEKALNWEIFKIIDNVKWLQIIYYGILIFITVYCLSFALTKKPYSKKWYHYLILICFCFGCSVFRMLATYTMQLNILIDVIVYIFVPFVITITMDKEDRLFDKNVFGIMITLSINIFLYFSYMGIGYWSGILNSLIPNATLWLTSSANMLIQLEVYIGMITLMLSLNELVKFIKRRS